MPPPRFAVPIASLRRRTSGVRQVSTQGPVDDLAVLGAEVPGGADVAVELVLSAYPGGIAVTGFIDAPWRAECRRCGGRVDGSVHVEVRERFVEGDCTGEDEDAYPLDGDLVDLEPMVRDAVMLALPLAPLCADDCRGLCPGCGADRNAAPCGCAPVHDPRWAALDALSAGSAGSEDSGTR